jgi:hypothetical protein
MVGMGLGFKDYLKVAPDVPDLYSQCGLTTSVERVGASAD